MPVICFFLCFFLYKKKEKIDSIQKLKKYPCKKEHYIEKKHLTNRFNLRRGNGGGGGLPLETKPGGCHG